MTFTEAAIEVLRREGKPLHFDKIAEIAVRESLLDHVGKVPEETMADQLAAHCRLPRPERRLVPVAAATFALVEWGIEEDPSGLDGLIQAPPELGLLYRGRERHPIPSRELARSAGRGEGGRARRREEEEGRGGRRFPPPAEVAYEILAGAARPLTLLEIATQGAERTLMPDAFVADTGSLLAALSQDNRRRESAGRKPLFEFDGETVTLVAQPEPGERPAPAPARAGQAPAELRRAGLAALRRRLRECDGPTVEHVAGRLLEKLAFRDLKVAKRGREHVIYTGRRRMGVADVRHAIRILRSGADASRRDVVDLRRDLGHYGAQLGIVLTAGDAARDARGEAGAAAQLPIVLLCGEALAEAFADAGVGCVPIVVPEVDEGFFRSAAEVAEREEASRRARREEREKREVARRQEPAPSATPEAAADVAPVAVAIEGAAAGAEEGPAPEPPAERAPVVLVAEAEDGGDEEGEEEGEEGEPEIEGGAAEGAAASPEGAAADASAERRRRRRRRRRRGGRGRGREAAQGGAEGSAPPAGGPAPEPTTSSGAGDVGAPAIPPSSPAPAPASEDGGGGGGGGSGTPPPV